MILNQDKFGRLIQTIPGMIPKLVFNHQVVTKNEQPHHNVHVVLNPNFRISTLKFSFIDAHYRINVNSEGQTDIRFLRDIAHSSGFHPKNVFHLTATTYIRASLTWAISLTWAMRFDDVPFFVDVPYDRIKELGDMPPVLLAGWLEDYADSVEYSSTILAEQYRHGVRLIQTAVEHQ